MIVQLRVSVAAVILVAATASVSAGQASTNSPSSAVSAIRAADQAWLAVFAAKDLTRSVAFIAPSGAVLAPDAPGAHGPEAVRNLFANFFQIPSFTIQWTPTSASVARSGELGSTSGTYAMEVTDSTGHRVPDHGKYVTVWQKQSDGQWKVLLDIFNSDGASQSQ